MPLSDPSPIPSPPPEHILEPDEPLPARAAFPVVGVGASAGGLEALRALLGALPVDTGMGFVIVQHLAPEHASSLAEILARSTKMPVCEVGEEAAVEPDHVYVIPPGRDMIVAAGKLVLLAQQRHAAHRGIDRFFRSLAEDSAHLAIGVVLSGGLRDGTVGLEEIKAACGVTFAQDDSAQHESMPRSAVASGCVDFVLPPERIAEELARIARHSYIAFKADTEDNEAASHGTIADLIRGATGVDFTHYKASTLRRRITRRMMLHRLETQADYEEHLRNTPEEIEELYQDILISVTSFFRDPEAFEALARDVFPKLLSACPAGEAVRLWIVGCSSGEEAYSLAMVFTECAEAAESAARLQIFATDVNPRCVEKARAGYYPRSIAQEVSSERLERFFTEENDGYRVCKSIRERCVFSRHNLLSDPPFSRVDFISCRNLLIYLEPTLQQRVLPIFHYALKAEGWLWLGSSESAGTTSTLFDAADLRHKIFTRRAGDRPPSTRPRNASPGSFTGDGSSQRQPGHGALHRDAERLLLAKYAPPGVVISVGLEIVQFQGDTSPYLAPASGAASHHLLKMLREGLAGGVREAVQRAEKESGPVRAEGLRVRHDGRFRTVSVEVIPLQPAPGKSGGFVVLFHGESKLAPVPKPDSWLGQWWKKMRGRAAAATSSRDAEIRHLTLELAATRDSVLAVSEQHEAVNEELRSANEEAQSANEEMQIMNEELETSKEEMEARNEELKTLNDELGERNAELNRVNEELRAARDYAERILENVPRPLLVLDAELRVRRASRAFYETFLVAPTETAGRYIYELGDRQWDIPALRNLLEQVLPQDGEVRDFEVRHTFPALGPRVMRLNARRLTKTGDEPLMILSIEDITERSLAAEALRRSEAQYRAIGESIDYGVWVCAPDGRNLYASDSFLKLVGLTQEQCSSLWGEVLHPEDAERTIAAWQECVRTAGNWDMEHRFRGVDGKWHAVLARGVPVKNEHGEVVSWAGINLDISGLKRAEEAVRKSEARFRAAVGAVSSLIWTNNADGMMEGEQPGWANFTGQTREESQGYGWSKAVHPDDAQPTIDAWNAAVEEERTFVFEHRVRRHDGAWRLCSIKAVPVFDEHTKIREWVGVHTDITESREVEEALRTSEAFKRSIIESTSDCIKVLDLEGNLISLEAGQQLLGIANIGPLLGTSWIDFWTRDQDRAAAHAAVAAAAAGGEGHFIGFFRTPPGEDKWWDIAISPIPDSDGRVAKLLAVSRDSTERYEMEQILEGRAKALAQADRSKDEFLAMLAHELRNPLAPLRNATELLNTDGVTDEERTQAQRIIGRQIENMSRMLDDLLDVSRITEGKITLRKEPVALEAVLTAATSLARSGCAARSQELALVLPAEPVFLNADATRLEQVFGNLLGNACKYAGQGCHIALKAERGEREVIVTVSDDGIGIDPEMLPHVFDLFVQSSRTLDRVHGGLGIGLTLVQRLVNLHGGSIEAHSEGLGKGAEFVVRLPILAKAPPPAPLPPPPATRAVPRRILIVDDNTDSARSLATLQSRRGHDTRTAFTGLEALSVATEYQPEVVLLDIGLPGMDGFEVARQIRALPALAEILLVAMTGYASEEDRAQARAAGFDEHLVKPVDLDVLREWLASHPRLAPPN
ncbi:MAG: CheR family methyltransferase [Chthoniobacteraceae bacterium]